MRDYAVAVLHICVVIRFDVILHADNKIIREDRLKSLLSYVDIVTQ